MREATGNTWILGLVLTFILIFTAFLCLAVNYSKAFKVKNEFLSILEKYEGYTETSRKIINEFLAYSGYSETGTCPSGYSGETSLSNTGKTMSTSNKNYYCIRERKKNSDGRFSYDIVLFYRFNLPVLGELGVFKINGKTKAINCNANHTGGYCYSNRVSNNILINIKKES